MFTCIVLCAVVVFSGLVTVGYRLVGLVFKYVEDGKPATAMASKNLTSDTEPKLVIRKTMVRWGGNASCNGTSMKAQAILLALAFVALAVFFYCACDAQREMEEAGTRTRAGGFAGSQRFVK